jgi:hypothetical protein
LEPISLQDALDYCLENPDGLSAQELLEAFPQFRGELALLLGLTAAIESAAPSVPAANRAAMKARIVSAAAQIRPPRKPSNPTPNPVEAAPVPAPAPARRNISGPIPLDAYTRRRTPVLLRPGFIAAAAAALIIAFVWWSSLGALPDSPFYNVRIASENITINFTGSEADQASAHLDAATSRLYDLREMQRRDKLVEAQEAVVNYEHHLSSAEALWRGLDSPPVEIAEHMYVASVAGRVTFDSLWRAEGTLPAPYRRDIAAAEGTIVRAGGGAEQALVQAGRDPAAVLTAAASGNTELAALVAGVVPTLTVPLVPPTSTGTTADGSTPTAVAVLPASTATAVVVQAPAATDTPRAEPPRATPSPPRATPSPPRATPSPPRPATHTPRPVAPTRTPRPLPSATRTPVIVQASVCDLSITSVTVTCREQGGVNWFALVSNRGDGPVTATWVAQLEVQSEGGGGFVPVMSVSGNDVFSPGPTMLNRTLQYPFAPSALKARVVVRFDTSGYACTVPAKQSLDVASCNRQNPGGKPDKTKTPPGLENKPTPRPRDEPQQPNVPDDKKDQGGPQGKP